MNEVSFLCFPCGFKLGMFPNFLLFSEKSRVQLPLKSGSLFSRGWQRAFPQCSLLIALIFLSAWITRCKKLGLSTKAVHYHALFISLQKVQFELVARLLNLSVLRDREKNCHAALHPPPALLVSRLESSPSKVSLSSFFLLQVSWAHFTTHCDRSRHSHPCNYKLLSERKFVVLLLLSCCRRRAGRTSLPVATVEAGCRNCLRNICSETL